MKMIIQFWAAVFTTIVLSLFALKTGAQNTITAKVDAFIKAEMQKQKIPGLSIGLIKNGRLIYSRGYGFANVEHNVPVKPATIFQSGSIGKQFTSMAVMMLVEEGKIGLDDKITKYFKDAPAEWKSITIRHLLTHTSGMTDFPKGFNYRADYSEDEMFKEIKSVPLFFQPGEKWAYSNIAYITLGMLINKVSGKFYGDFLQERIFQPLGMLTTRVINEGDIIPNRAAGYRLEKGELKNQEWVSPTLNTTADGSLYLTVLDVAKWEAALNTKKFISKIGYAAMWSPVTLNSGKTHPYGFGWMLDNVNGKRIIEHSGSWQGFKSMITRYPQDKFAVVILANLVNAIEKKLARGVLEIYYPELKLSDKKMEDKEPGITIFVKDILQKGTEDKLTSDLFTTEAAPEILTQSKK